MKFLNVINATYLFLKKCRKDNINAFSAQSAFFVVISAFPFAMLLMAVIKYVSVSADDFMNIISSFLPVWFNTFISTYVNEIKMLSDRAIISVSSVTALYAASKGVLAIISGLNSIAGISETRNIVKLYFTAVIYTFILIVIIIITLGFLVFGNTIYNYLCEVIPYIKEMAHVLSVIRIIFSIAVLTLFFMLLYTVVPDRKTSLFSQIPGALLCSLGWIGFSFLYSLYIGIMRNHSLIYGSLSTIVLFMVWLYFCMYMLFVGAEVNNSLSLKNSDFKSGKTKGICNNKK